MDKANNTYDLKTVQLERLSIMGLSERYIIDAEKCILSYETTQYGELTEANPTYTIKNFLYSNTIQEINEIFELYTVSNWDSDYENNDIYDGENWYLTYINIAGDKKIIKGQNAYPECWNDFISDIKKVVCG